MLNSSKGSTQFKVYRDVSSLIKRRRTLRKFLLKAVPSRLIKLAIDASRFAPSAGNLQFLEYLVVKKKQARNKIFPHLKWAAYLRPLGTPGPQFRPTAYIIVLKNKHKSHSFDQRDVGASVMCILLVLESLGVGSCWIASCQRQALRKILKIPSYLDIDSVIALGFPAQKSKVVRLRRNIKYYLDSQGNLCVPKRALKDVLFWERYRKQLG